MMSSRRRRRNRGAVARALGVPERALDPSCRDELAHRLVHAHKGMVWRLAQTLLVDGRDVEEVVNGTFAQALREVEHFRGDCSGRTWLWRICRNLSLDRLRRRRLDSVPLEDGHVQVADQQCPDVRLLLEEAIGELTPYEESLFRAVAAGYSISELAREMGVKRSTLSGHYNAVVDQLRRRIGPHLDRLTAPEEDDALQEDDDNLASSNGGG